MTFSKPGASASGLGVFGIEPSASRSMLEIPPMRAASLNLCAEIAAEFDSDSASRVRWIYDHSDNTLSAYEDSADSMVDG